MQQTTQANTTQKRSGKSSVQTTLIENKALMTSHNRWPSYMLIATTIVVVIGIVIVAYQFFVPGQEISLTITLLTAIALILFLLLVFIFTAYISTKKELSLFKEQSAEMKQNGRFMQEMLNHQQEIQSELLARQDLSDRLLRMVRSTAMTTSLEVALEKILDASCTITHAEVGSLLLVDSGGKVTNSYLSRRSNRGDESKKLIGQVMRNGLASWIFRSGQAVILNDAGNDERWITLPDAPYEAGSVLGVPINSGTVVTGILTLIHPSKAHFRDDDLGLMQDAASQIALAVRNSQIFEEQKRMVDRQTALYDVLQSISQKLTPESVEIDTVKKVTELTGWSTAAILHVDTTGQFLVPVAREGAYPPNLHYKIVLDETSAAGEAFLQNKRVEIINTLGLATHEPLHPKTRSEVYVPIQKRGKVNGVLAFGDIKPYAFSEDEVTLIESISEATSLATTNAHLFQEISEQQGRLEALINSSNDGIILISQDQDILVVNQPALNLLNLYHDPNDWLGKPINHLSKSLQAAGFIDFSERFSSQLDSIESVDLIDFQPDHEEYDIGSNIITVSFLPVIGKDEYVGYLCILRDITEQKLLTRLRDDLTHSIVHDLKNPLWMLDTGLKLLTDTLNNQGSLGEPEVQMLDISTSQVDRMLSLVNAILDISRLEDRKMPLSREVFDIRTSIDEIIHLMRPEAQKKNVSIESNCDNFSQVVMLDADKDLISRILQNLIGNALKFTPEKGLITIMCEREIGAQNINIRVKDTGPGISNSMTSHIFEKFATGSHDESGSGLGLAFCKMAIEAHNGTIAVEETSSNGTTFKFSLPLAA